MGKISFYDVRPEAVLGLNYDLSMPRVPVLSWSKGDFKLRALSPIGLEISCFRVNTELHVRVRGEIGLKLRMGLYSVI